MLKALLVEDYQSFRETIREGLSKQFPGLIIEEAADGKEAMMKVDSFRPDLVFMDIRLPDASGLQLTRKIKARYPEVRVVILTQYDLPEYREAASQYGANHFLVKGMVTMEEILTLVGSFFPVSHQPGAAGFQSWPR